MLSVKENQRVYLVIDCFALFKLNSTYLQVPRPKYFPLLYHSPKLLVISLRWKLSEEE